MDNKTNKEGKMSRKELFKKYFHSVESILNPKMEKDLNKLEALYDKEDNTIKRFELLKEISVLKSVL